MTGALLITRLRTYASLGVPSVARAAGYRAGLRSGALARLLPAGPPLAPPRIREDGIPAGPHDRLSLHREELLDEGRAFLRSEISFFDGRRRCIGSPPNFSNPVDPPCPWDANAHWTEIDEFADEAADIKDVWEPSRFVWLLRAAAATAVSGDAVFLERANEWISAWTAQNPIHRGPNWKCGQEAAIRLTHFLLARELVEDRGADEPTITFVQAHLRRIAATGLYARAQDNDHLATEGLGLYLGGQWLRRHAPGAATADEGQQYASLGRRGLERTASRLVAGDGSFANYSLNYHRVVLDCFSWAERTRRDAGDTPFSRLLCDRFEAAREWLAAMTDPESGDAPNLGSNDGGRIAPLVASNHRDFRDTNARAELASRAGPPPSVIEMLVPSLPDHHAKRRSRLFDDGGTAVACLDEPHAPWALLRHARFRFRPAQADIGHLEIWHQGRAVTRDTGTFRYQSDAASLSYFGSTASHNTAQFDDREQMPRISRFLFGDWLRTERMEIDASRPELRTMHLAYQDAEGARHERRVVLRSNAVEVHDRLSGFHRHACLRWHLAPLPWTLVGRTVESAIATIFIDGPISEVRMDEGWESLRYGERRRIPVLLVETTTPDAEIRTKIELPPRAERRNGV